MKVENSSKRYGLEILTLVLGVLLLTGCGNKIDYSLPDNPIAFETATYTNPTDSEDTYTSIEYNGRTYIGYGTLKGNLTKEDVGDCLGFIVQDNVRMEDTRIFTLTTDAGVNYLARLETEGVMNQPDFFRAIDTLGQDIATPDFIEDLGYDFWKLESLPESSEMDLFYSNAATEGYEDIRELGENYSADQAQMDNCFIVGAMVHNDYLYSEFMEKYKNGDDAFIRVVQTTTEGDPIIYDLLYTSETNEVLLITDTTRDKFAAGDDREIELAHYTGTMEYEEDGHLYWVVYQGEPDKVSLDDGNTFVVVFIN